jgi:hypothetical protein
MGVPPTQGNEERRQPLSIDPPLSPCHPDRSEAEWRDPRYFAGLLGLIFPGNPNCRSLHSAALRSR